MIEKQFNERANDVATAILEFLGTESVFKAKREAQQNQTKTTISADGMILGGELKIMVTFDETVKESNS